MSQTSSYLTVTSWSFHWLPGNLQEVTATAEDLVWHKTQIKPHNVVFTLRFL